MQNNQAGQGVVWAAASDQVEIKQEELLRRRQRAEIIGILANGIAHDLNNILGVIRGYAGMLNDDARGEMPLSTSDRCLYIGQILQAVLRSKELVQRINSFIRQEEQEKRPLSLEMVVQEVVSLLRSGGSKRVKLKFSCNTNPQDLIEADPSQIHQVLMNLCTNAYQAMEGSGVLSIDVSQCDTTPGKEPGVQSEGYVRLTVSDTGCGIERKNLKRIFERYFTTKQSGGSGLGLSIVQEIVEFHQGTITVESEPEKGTVFSLYFPKCKKSKEKALRFSLQSQQPSSPQELTVRRLLDVSKGGEHVRCSGF